jgi:DMSO/TMAO reductase YedYZ heme-binding membrane subunit
MKFLIGLSVVIVFIALFRRQIKTHPGIFYVVALLLNIPLIYSVFGRVPVWYMKYFLFLVQNASLPLALFTVVMYIGVLREGSTLHKNLLPIRAELSIIAGILSLGHIFIFGRIFILNLLLAPAFLPSSQMIATTIAIALVVVLMLPLVVTSLKAVRSRMKPVSWRRLQLLAYPFYLFIYAHIIMFLLPSAIAGSTRLQVSIAVYSVVFLGYVVLRIRRHHSLAHIDGAGTGSFVFE